MELVPYTPLSITTLPQTLSQGPEEELPGQCQGVYITLKSPDYQFLLNKITGWFRDRDEVELVDHGTSDKIGLGYIILEWTECTVDRLFPAILRDEEIVVDYTVYTRSL